MSLVEKALYRLNGIDSAAETTQHGDQQSSRPTATDTRKEFEVPSEEKINRLTNHKVK